MPIKSPTRAKKPLKKNKNFWLKTMNNTKANGLQNAQILKIAYSGLISAGINRKTVLYSLKGPLESN